MSEVPKSKKIWDRAAWRDAAFFLNYLRPHFNVFIPALVALTLTSGLTMGFVYMLTTLLKLALATEHPGPALMAEANHTVPILIGIVGLQAFIAFWRIMLFAKASERSLAKLRMDTFSRIIRLPMVTLNRRRSAELASRLANDVEAMRETLVVTIPMLIRHSVMLLASTCIVFAMSFRLALFMLATIPVVVILIAFFGARIRRLTRKAQDDLALSQVVVDESLQSIISVKAYRNEDYEIKRYNTQLGHFLATALRAAMPRGLFIAFIIFCFSLALTSVIWFGIRMLCNADLNQGQFMLFGAFSAMITASFMQFPELIAQLQRTLGATERVREILDETVEPLPDSAPKQRFRGEISVRNVEFAYPTRPEATVLKEFSFEATAGQRIALVGPSGSGKTTSIALLYRFYEPVLGEILIDGQPIKDMDLTTLRRNLALVPQEILLFGGSIRENIAYGKPGASAEDVVAAAKKANAHQFIEALPQGYDTLVGERGTQVSGGQRQRIAIARAILADPAILILDEATSSLDAESERLVQDALDKLMENRTSIIVAHRLSTVRRCNQILVMSAGTIVERGTHEELLQRPGGLYGTLARLQLE